MWASHRGGFSLQSAASGVRGLQWLWLPALEGPLTSASTFVGPFPPLSHV